MPRAPKESAHIIHALVSPLLGEQIAIGAVVLDAAQQQRVVRRALPVGLRPALAGPLAELERMALDPDPMGWPIHFSRCLTVAPQALPARAVLSALEAV